MASEQQIKDAKDFEKILNDDIISKDQLIWEPVYVENTIPDDDELRATVFRYKVPDGSSCWFKIVGKVRTSLSEMTDILDTNLLGRQREWHELFIEGKILANCAPGVELCWMAYSSGTALVSDRDFVYYKISRSNEDSFQLSYRTLTPLEEKEDQQHLQEIPARKYVRGAFTAAHFIEAQQPNLVSYTYFQCADPKGLIPLFLTWGPQSKILVKEIGGLRKATQKSKNE